MSSLIYDPAEKDPYRCHCGAWEMEGATCLCVHCCVCGKWICESPQGDDGLNICDECYYGE